jgi:hypothetical protein
MAAYADDHSAANLEMLARDFDAEAATIEAQDSKPDMPQAD